MQKVDMLKEINQSFTDEFIDLVQSYQNTVEYNQYVWIDFYKKTDTIDYLKNHRDYIVNNSYGWGNRPFHYMWKILVEQMPENFSFLEIGVHKAQILSLIGILCNRLGKQAKIIGVTPFELFQETRKVGFIPFIKQKVSRKVLIEELYNYLGLTYDNTIIFDGYSEDKLVQNQVETHGTFDLVFIDGDHKYEVVANDIKCYSKMLRKGGFIIMDDSSNFLEFPDYYEMEDKDVNPVDKKFDNKKFKFSNGKAYRKVFKGCMGVSEAVRDLIESNDEFLYLFACGHNRVWMKLN
ncbi:MAG: class I SAM-dependent methyltransferase [Microcoleaceae cyanobacterium MO_207.B10]|nr:class I SAM-dependent methyltransferase [Microcoleaceae cyanobacterium MO_207.B10]